MTARSHIANLIIGGWLLFGVWVYHTAANPVVVLPERFANREIIVQNSTVYKALVQKNKTLADQLSREQRDLVKLKKDTDKTIQDKDLELDHLRATQAQGHKNVFRSILSVVTLVFQFVSNPFQFLISRAIQIGLALLVIVTAFFVIRHFIRKRRK